MKDDSTCIPETEIVKAAQEGSQEAFTILYERYYRYVGNIVYQVLQSHDDIDDIVQDVFTSVYQHINNFNGDALFTTWLTRIALLTAKSHIRCLVRRKELLCIYPAIHKTEITPEELYSDREEQSILHQLIDELPEVLSSVAKLHLEDYSLAEIAQRLNISKVAANSRNYRIKPALAQKWISLQTNYEKDL